MYFDSITDPLPTESLGKLAIESVKLQSWRALIDTVLEWSPRGIDIEDE